MWLLYDIYREKKRSLSWVEMFTIRRLLKYTALITPGFVIMFYRFKIMNFEGPIFTSNDNPTAFAESLFSRVSFFGTVCFLVKLHIDNDFNK